jgi:hypothetical protein
VLLDCGLELAYDAAIPAFPGHPGVSVFHAGLQLLLFNLTES